MLDEDGNLKIGIDQLDNFFTEYIDLSRNVIKMPELEVSGTEINIADD